MRRADTLAIEIAAVLVVKAVLLWLLWWAFFSDPLARHMRVEPALIERQLLHSAPPGRPKATTPPRGADAAGVLGASREQLGA